jgi:hypothetical protein
MDFKIVHNIPYVILLMGTSALFNMILHIDTPWTMIVSWTFEYFIILWFYQTHVPKKDETSWKSFLKSQTIMAGFLLMGGLIGHRLYYGPVGALTCITYALFIPFVLIILEYSLYN